MSYEGQTWRISAWGPVPTPASRVVILSRPHAIPPTCSLLVGGSRETKKEIYTYFFMSSYNKTRDISEKLGHLEAPRAGKVHPEEPYFLTTRCWEPLWVGAAGNRAAITPRPLSRPHDTCQSHSS